MRARVGGAALAVLGAAWVAGCTGRSGDGREVLVRIADVAAAEQGWREPAVVKLGAEARAALGDVGVRTTRLASPDGDTPGMLVTPDARGQVTAEVACPSGLAGQVVVGVPACLAPDGDNTGATVDPIRCSERGAFTRVVVRGLLPGRACLLAVAIRPIPPAVLRSPAVAVPRNAHLVVDLGVEVQRDHPGVTVRYQLVAENRAGDVHRLASWTRAAAQAGWQEVELSLEETRARLGTPLAFVFQTELVGSAPAGAVVPVWGNPRLVGPRRRWPAPNVLLISLDTLRADRLGAYGNPLDLTPELDRLAREGTTFEFARSESNWTLPSHATLLTGTFACVHGLRQAREMRPFPVGIVPLAELLRDRGYLTAAFTENAYVDPVPFQRGFDVFVADGRLGLEPGGMIDTTVDRTSAWLRRHHREGPFFVLFHTYEVHHPYDPPASARARLAADALPMPPGVPPPAPEHLAEAIAYTAEVAHTDEALGRLRAQLEELALDRNTLVVVTSDHGEAFGEHGVTRHWTGIHEEQLRIPMIWWGPGRVAAGRRVAGLVGLGDVAPTILDLLGLAVPSWMQGRSLRPSLTPHGVDTVPSRVYPVDGGSGRGLRQDGWKIVLHPRPELYRLGDDPGERDPRPVPPDLLHRATRELDRSCQASRTRLGDAPMAARRLHVPADDAERRAKLRALGYLEP